MILNSSKEQLLAYGLPNTKAKYIRLIAQEFEEHPNLIEGLREMPSEAVLETLQSFKGIDIWSVSVLALFYLHHPSIFF
jgi:3-methyladenine DNA glycosylase/8-oxoguanine DNA glycosylase